MKKKLVCCLVSLVALIVMTGCNLGNMFYRGTCPNDPQIEYYVAEGMDYDFVCNDNVATWTFSDGTVVTGYARVDSVDTTSLGMSFEFFLTDKTHTNTSMNTCYLNRIENRLFISPAVIDLAKENKIWEESAYYKLYGPLHNMSVKCFSPESSIAILAVFEPQMNWVVSPK